MYIKLNFHCPATDAIGGGTPDSGSACVLEANLTGGTVAATMVSAGCVEANIMSQYLMRVPYYRGPVSNSWDGACLNMIPGSDTANAYDFSYGATHTGSFHVERDDNDATDLVTVFSHSAPGCVDRGTTSGTGFLFGEQVQEGKAYCGGVVAGTRGEADWGINIGAVDVTSRAIFSGIRWSKKSFAGQIMGPFNNDTCKTFPAFGGTTIHMPIVVPLEDAVIDSTHTASPTVPAITKVHNGELAVSSTIRCWNMNSAANGTTAGDAEWVGLKTTGNAGEFEWIFTEGVGAERDVDANGVTDCKLGATVHKIVFKMDYTGKADLCKESIAANGNGSSSYFLFRPSYHNTLGEWSSSEDIPAAAPGASPSPAFGLHFSAGLAALIAFITLLM